MMKPQDVTTCKHKFTLVTNKSAESIVTIGERVSKIVLETAVSQRDFAEKIGVSHGAVSQWIAGNRMLTLRSARKIESRVGVSADWLLRGEEPKYREPVAEAAGPPPATTQAEGSGSYSVLVDALTAHIESLKQDNEVLRDNNLIYRAELADANKKLDAIRAETHELVTAARVKPHPRVDTELAALIEQIPAEAWPAARAGLVQSLKEMAQQYRAEQSRAEQEAPRAAEERRARKPA